MTTGSASSVLVRTPRGERTQSIVTEEPDITGIPDAELLITRAMEGDKISQALCKKNKKLLNAIRFRKSALVAKKEMVVRSS